MKYTKMVECQQKAVKNIDTAASKYIYELLLACYQCHLNSPEFSNCYSKLNDNKTIVDKVYKDATTNMYDPSAPRGSLRDINRCGKSFLENLVKHFVYKYQQQALAELKNQD